MIPLNNPRKEYVGTGLLKVYSFDFKIFNISDLLVQITDDDFNLICRVRGTDSTYIHNITINPKQGGTLVLKNVLHAGYLLTILSANDGPVQLTDLKERTSFGLPELENDLDALIVLSQRKAYLLKRSLKIGDKLSDEETFDTNLDIHSTDTGVQDNRNKVLIVGSDNASFQLGPSYLNLGGEGSGGSNGATWRTGSGAPSDSLGVDDDLYLDTATENVHKRASGTYSIITNIKGSTGATGPAGSNGTNGTNGADGATGATGAKGDKGDTGNTGLTGTTGSTGSTGSNGTNGTNGNTVLNGSGTPGAGTGQNGDFYIDTTNQLLYGPKAAGAWPGSPVSFGQLTTAQIGARAVLGV